MAKVVVTELNSEVLLVVGSVSDMHLEVGRNAIKAGGCKTKLVRMSRETFIDEFVPALKDLGTYGLDRIVDYVERQGRPAPIEFRGIANPNGFIGGVIMDRKSWNQFLMHDVPLDDAPIWATSRNGQRIELMQPFGEVAAA